LVEYLKKPPTFSYPCNEKTKYINKNDGDTAPANYSFSSINDTMYFSDITLNMYKEYFGVDKPLGTDLPLRAYTHIKEFDNALAVPTVKIKGIYIIHQQIVIGDGDQVLSAPAQGTVAHELSHNFTRLNSNLIYEGQSGGVNESFSDMASIAMQDYLRKDYPWYWDGLDWTIGQEATIGATPLRYMSDPAKDGKSINNAKDYNEKLDVHSSSGVFNKAFYLLAHKPSWTIRQAFQIMVDANINYWTSGTHFDAAACGVIQAAKDRKYNYNEVIDVFAEVGVTCPIKSVIT
jgi:pseudolysin